MSGGNVIGSQKEMTAVINNLKESRVLDKGIDTLTLEESYSVKLLDLSTKMVNLQYNRLQANVSKIRTHLRPEHIASMRTLELEGKFKAESPIVASSSESKIAAAAKRLKFNNYNYKRSASANPWLGKHNKNLVVLEKNTTPNRQCRRQSIMSNQSEVAAVLCKRVRPHTSKEGDTLAYRRESNPDGKLQRPNTALILERIATAQKSRKNLSRQTIYCCHDGKSNHGDSMMPNEVFGPNPYEVRRKRFLSQETSKSQELAAQQGKFLEETTEFVRENPSVYHLRPEATQEVIQSIDSMATRTGSDQRKKKLKRGKSIIERVDSALLRHFSEIRKMQLDDSFTGFTGVNTLSRARCSQAQVWSESCTKTKVSFEEAEVL